VRGGVAAQAGEFTADRPPVLAPDLGPDLAPDLVPKPVAFDSQPRAAPVAR